MFYDFILGKTLADNFMSDLYSNRFEESEITSYPQLVSVLYREFSTALSKINIVPSVLERILSGLNYMNSQYKKGAQVDLVDTTIREMLSVASFNGYEIYLVKRPDIKVQEMVPATRAYMIDKNDMFFPTISRIATGTSLTFEVPQEASFSDVVMTFSKKFRFGDTTIDFVGIDKAQQQYDKLAESRSGWRMDTRRIENFFNDFGYKFFVVM